MAELNMMQLIRKANNEQALFEDFELTLFEKAYKLRISMPDIFDIIQDQQLAKSEAYAKCRAAGLTEYSIDQEKWDKQLKAIEDPELRKQLEDKKPLNLAQQEAEEISRLTTIRTLLPKIIRYAKNEELLCKTSDDRIQLGKYMANNSACLNIITEAWSKIMVRYSQVQDTVKNSSTESKAASSDSK